MIKLILFVLITVNLSTFADQVSEPAVLEESEDKAVDKPSNFSEPEPPKVKLKRAGRENSKNLSGFMPGSFGIGFGTSKGSENLHYSRSIDFHFMYFPWALGFGAYYQYDEFRNIQTTTFNAEQVQGGVELLIRLSGNPIFSYMGISGGKGRFNRLNQLIGIDDKSQAVFGALGGLDYVINDAFSVGPSFRWSRLNNAENIDTLSAKLEFQYRFVLY